MASVFTFRGGVLSKGAKVKPITGLSDLFGTALGFGIAMGADRMLYLDEDRIPPIVQGIVYEGSIVIKDALRHLQRGPRLRSRLPRDTTTVLLVDTIGIKASTSDGHIEVVKGHPYISQYATRYDVRDGHGDLRSIVRVVGTVVLHVREEIQISMCDGQVWHIDWRRNPQRVVNSPDDSQRAS